MASSCSDSDDWSDNDVEYDDCDDYNVCSKCLFCEKTFPTSSLTWSHITDQHKVSLLDLKRYHNLNDQYLYIKFINFVRRKSISLENILKKLDAEWRTEEYLKPVLPDDPMLMHGKI